MSMAAQSIKLAPRPPSVGQVTAVLLNHYLRSARRRDGADWPDQSGTLLLPARAEDGCYYLLENEAGHRYILADEKGKVTSFELDTGLLDLLFKSKDMPQEEFLQRFVDSYGVSQLDPDLREFSLLGEQYAQRIWSYRCDQGWEVTFYGDFVLGENPYVYREREPLVARFHGLTLLGASLGRDILLTVGANIPEPGTMLLKQIRTATERQATFD